MRFDKTSQSLTGQELNHREVDTTLPPDLTVSTALMYTAAIFLHTANRVVLQMEVQRCVRY
jgi:hypothetical protein